MNLTSPLEDQWSVAKVPPVLSGWRWAVVVGFIALAALGNAMIGSGNRLPLDDHDVFVARTAEVMMRRGDWLVPYLGIHPRLEKPPMSYWLVCLVDRLGDHDSLITPFESRLPSVLAGMVVVLVTLVLGVWLLDRPTAVIGALLHASSNGYIQYTHRARPEMVYAMWCMLGLMGFIWVLRSSGSAKAKRWVTWGAWVMLGLGMLTKGPHVPAIIVLGMVVGLWKTGCRSQWRSILRPVSGLLIFGAVSIWWYVAIYYTVSQTQAVWGNQISGRFLMSWGMLGRWLNPYYLYRPITLVLPWAMLYPLALAMPWLASDSQRRSVRLLWWLVVSGMVLLSLAVGRRPYYILPLLGPLCLLMGAGGLSVGRWLMEGPHGRRTWFIAWSLHALGLASAGVYLAWTASVAFAPSPVAAGLVVVAAAWAVGLLAWRYYKGKHGLEMELVAVLLVGLVLMPVVLYRQSVWGERRFERTTFAEQVRQYVPADQLLIGWFNQSWNIEAYHLKRDIPKYSRIEEIEQAVQTQGQLWLLVNQKKASNPEIRWPYEVKAASVTSTYRGDADRLELLYIHASDVQTTDKSVQ